MQESPHAERTMLDRLNRLLPYLALTAAAVLVVVLGRDKRELITRYEELQARYRQAVTEPQRGQYMPAFQTATLDGQAATIGQLPAEGKQVLFIYTTTCRYCLSTIPAWKQLTATLDTLSAPAVQVFGVSLDSVQVTKEYATKHALTYPTVRFPDERLMSMYRAGTVPMVIVLDEQGRTVYSRVGELKEPAAIDSVIQAVKWKPAPRDSTQAQPQAGQRVASR
jgi:peroxiredoxin